MDATNSRDLAQSARGREVLGKRGMAGTLEESVFRLIKPSIKPNVRRGLYRLKR